MQTANRTALLLSLLVLAASSALAEVVITTDKPAYLMGEIVQITVQNTGPLGTDFVSAPFVSIYNVDTNECLLGCVGLPVVTPFPAGATETYAWDTGWNPDPVGTYRVFANILGVTDFAQYTLTGEVDIQAVSWGAIKALYRD